MSARSLMLWRDLWHLRGPAFAVALVVASAVAAFVATRANYESLLKARDDFYAAGRFADVFAQLKRAPLELTARIKSIPGVAQADSRVVSRITLDIPGLDEPATGRLISIPEVQRPMLNDITLRSGRYIEPSRADEILVSEAFATANKLHPGDAIGAIINGRWKALRIAGIAQSPEYIYEVGAGTIFPDNRRFGVLWMGENALASAYGMEGAFNDISLRLTAGTPQQEVIDRLDFLLTPYGGLGAYGREDQLSHRFISDEIAQNRVTSSFLPAIFLGVAIFLLHTVLSQLTTMQRTQIGLLKAFGYDNFQVGAHYLLLALVIVLAGLLLGLALGIYVGNWITALYRDYYRFPQLALSISPRVVVVTLLITLGAAVMGSLGALRRAMRLPPAESMRPEPPARFRAGMLERIGLSDRLPSSVRMITRSIARRAARSLIAVIGIGCAVGILFIGRFGLDAMTRLLYVQFQVVQRDDVTVDFAEPRPGSATEELARLPGVLEAEPFRSVPARLQFGHRVKRTSITGLQPDGHLRRVVDAGLRSVRLPPGGVVLTRKLGDLLGVSAGDTISVAVLEGERPTRSVQVAGFADEPVGLGAYMDLQALNVLMHEGQTISGAYLRSDGEHRTALNRALKELPQVAGTTFREAVLRSFNDILDRSMRTVSIIEVAFACIIAFGVVYNGARIALSERGNELASLRVLGFTRGEVGFLLLGEQGLLTLAALPLGCALGVGGAWLLARRLETDLYRVPLVVSGSTVSFSILVVLGAALLSGLVVALRINRMDLISVLKSRE